MNDIKVIKIIYSLSLMLSLSGLILHAWPLLALSTVLNAVAGILR